MEERLKGTLKEVEAVRGDDRKMGRKRSLWDEECREEKKKVRRMLRMWRRSVGGEKEYRKRRRKYREMCNRKRREENLKWEREVEKASRESEVWKIVNRERRKRKRMIVDIGMEEWKEHFMRLLGGVEGRVIRGEGERKGDRRVERDIERVEMKRALRRLGEGKARGIDGIPGEVWKFGGEEIEGWAWEFCNRMWRGDR